MISDVSQVVMPVEDAQAALQFWTTTMGSRPSATTPSATNAGSRYGHRTKSSCWC